MCIRLSKDVVNWYNNETMLHVWQSKDQNELAVH